MVEDERLDELNRFLAIQALYFAAVSNEREDGLALLRRLKRSSMPTIGRAWIRGMEWDRRLWEVEKRYIAHCGALAAGSPSSGWILTAFFLFLGLLRRPRLSEE